LEPGSCIRESSRNFRLPIAHVGDGDENVAGETLSSEEYDKGQDIAVSETEGSVEAVPGNSTMMGAYMEGIPENGKPFREGSRIVKIEWIKKKNPVSPYFVELPDTLKSVPGRSRLSHR
jgi:hypothetical protein